MEEISNYEIVPEKHGVSKVCKIGIILPPIKESDTLIRLIRAFWEKEQINVIELIQKEEVLRRGSFINQWIDEMLLKGGDTLVSEDVAFRDYSMLGMKPGRNCGSSSDTRTILALADLKKRQGKVQEAMDDLYCLLNQKGLEPGYWIVCKVRWINCVNIITGHDHALEIIEKEITHTVNPGHKAWLIFLKADILSDMGTYERANEHFKHSIRIMTLKRMHISLAEVRNSYAVNLFRSNDYDKAEKQWIECRNLCITHDLPRMKALAEMNLSDSYSRKGQFRRAHDNLDRAQALLKEVGDLEGLSGVFFNRALVYVREGKVEKSHEAFREAESFPLVYKKKLDERRRVYNECLVENGYPILRNPI
jgi:hypothetical protein